MATFYTTHSNNIKRPDWTSSEGRYSDACNIDGLGGGFLATLGNTQYIMPVKSTSVLRGLYSSWNKTIADPGFNIGLYYWLDGNPTRNAQQLPTSNALAAAIPLVDAPYTFRSVYSQKSTDPVWKVGGNKEDPGGYLILGVTNVSSTPSAPSGNLVFHADIEVH